MTLINDLDDFKALDPFFRIIEQGLDGLADGDCFFDLLAEDVVFDYIITTPNYPRHVVGRAAVAELYRPYGETFVLDRSAHQSRRGSRARRRRGLADQVRELIPDGVDAALELVGAPTLPDTLRSVRVHKWDGIREAFHGFDPAQVAAMTPAEIAATENDPRVIRNKAKILATVENAREVVDVPDSHGSIRAYSRRLRTLRRPPRTCGAVSSFSARRGLWRLLISAACDIDG